MSSSRVILVLLLALLLSACGYQLQGAFTIPSAMDKTYIAAENKHSIFYRELRRVLRANDVDLVDSFDDATAVFHVTVDDSGQRVLSVSARNVPREYEVYYTVQYSVEDTEATLLEPQLLTLTRVYTYDETQVLGKDREAEFLRETIVKDMVRLIVRRLSSI